MVKKKKKNTASEMSDQLSHFSTATTPLPGRPHGHDFPTQTAALRLSGCSLNSCFTTGAADSQVTCGVSAKYSASLFARSPPEKHRRLGEQLSKTESTDQIAEEECPFVLG
ncbi:hypothetical protein fugu_001975 [Takifugu bimaculatus]|uniref:Uncharacterized protein n=1 Tax=Takifugu bimaculatus TaxID=433685 RepID=A0A4Z2BP20_9TELE|nr:hypothetical protein fugu_001975 [Takifugu bimaculatus]